MAPLIQLTDVTKTYGQGRPQPALANVSLAVHAGEFVSVRGASGSGKSTLLNLIAGLDRPSSGTVVVDGIDLGASSETQLARYRRSRIGFIFQFFHLLPDLSARENVVLPASLAGVARRTAEARARDLLERLGIAEKAHELPARLSGGERQRVAIARALISGPRLLLADEPTGALDSRTGQQLMELLAALHRDGQTILLVTHNPRIARYTQRTVTLQDGRIVEDAAAQRGILFTDVVGSTALLEAIGDAAWRELAVWLEATQRQVFTEGGGRVAGHTGDGFLVIFEGPADALDCAVALQRRLQAHRREHGFVPQVRTGVHAGGVAEAESAMRGSAIHRAARICALADGGQILASREALEASGYALANMRATQLKGVPGTVEVGEVEW